MVHWFTYSYIGEDTLVTVILVTYSYIGEEGGRPYFKRLATCTVSDNYLFHRFVALVQGLVVPGLKDCG